MFVRPPGGDAAQMAQVTGAGAPGSCRETYTGSDSDTHRPLKCSLEGHLQRNQEKEKVRGLQAHPSSVSTTDRPCTAALWKRSQASEMTHPVRGNSLHTRHSSGHSTARLVTMQSAASMRWKLFIRHGF